MELSEQNLNYVLIGRIIEIQFFLALLNCLLFSFKEEDRMSHFELRQKQMISMLERLVNTDSGTYHKEGVDEIGSYLQHAYERLGFAVERYPNDHIGDYFKIRHPEAVNPEIVIAAHLDTVFPKGTVNKRPFSIEGNRAYGPGVIDMKASHVLLYDAICQLIEAGHHSYKNIEIVLNSDEEIGSKDSKSFIESACDGKKVGLVLEPARANGAIVSARRGTGRYTIEVHGKSAHAGIDPENGRSAIEELAYKVIELHKLTNPAQNINVNAGLISGGTSTNSIAGYASCEVDVRIAKSEQAKWIEEQIKAIASTNTLDGVSTTLTGEIRRLPMVYTDKTKKLVELIQQTAKDLSFTLEHVATGGGSDASFIANKGIPTVDGLGPVGGKQHSEEEYLEIDSLVQRTDLFVGILKHLTDRWL